jgi:hypothetical protein
VSSIFLSSFDLFLIVPVPVLYEDAEITSRELLAELSVRYGPTSSKTLSAGLCALGVVLETGGKHREAVDVYKQCWQQQTVSDTRRYMLVEN